MRRRQNFNSLKKICFKLHVLGWYDNKDVNSCTTSQPVIDIVYTLENN